MKTTIGNLKKHILNEILDNQTFKIICNQFLNDVGIKTKIERVASTSNNEISILSEKSNFWIKFKYSADIVNAVETTKNNKSQEKKENKVDIPSKGESVWGLGWANVIKDPGWNRPTSEAVEKSEVVEKTINVSDAIAILRKNTDKVKGLCKKLVQKENISDRIDFFSAQTSEIANGIHCTMKTKNGKDVLLTITIISA